MSAAIESGLMDGDTLGKHNTIEHQISEDSLHEKFVNFVHALTGPTEVKSEVWMEHSYARARRGSGVTPRSLLVRRAPPCPDCHVDDDNVTVDVTTVDPPPEPPLSPEPQPHYELALSEEEICSLSCGDLEPDDCEEKLDSLAPSPTHRRLASNVVELIRSLRVARLSGAPRTARAHASALRRELAPLWNYPGPLQQRPAAWMHAVLSAYLPRAYLHVYNDMLSELARTVPRLVERLLAGQVPPAQPEREAVATRLQPSPGRPLLVWLPSGREKRDALWERNLAHLIPTHRITAPIVNACAPDTWCAAVASSARTALISAASVPRSATVLAGWGAGAALALHLASTWDNSAGTPPSALALLSPPLLTAEGSRDTLDDPMLELKVPMLFVVGQNAMQCTVGVAEEIRASLGAWSRLVVVGSADDALRLTQHKLRTERVTQPMVYAAIAEEVRGFVGGALRENADPCSEVMESEREPPEESEPEHTPPPQMNHRRRTSAAPIVTTVQKRQRYGVEPTLTPAPPPAAAAAAIAAESATSLVSSAAPSPGKGRGLALLRVSSAPPESSTLHGSTGRTSTDWEELLSTETHQHKTEIRRNIRVTETVVTRSTLLNGSSSKGYSVVSRGTGSVPLSLPPPRRAAASASPAPALAPADIMQLPIVFADDDNAGLDEEHSPLSADPAPAAALPVGSTILHRDSTNPLRYTKVILAKRPTTASPALTGTSPRPIIVKGGMKILPKGVVIKRGTSVSPADSTHHDKSPFDKSPV